MTTDTLTKKPKNKGKTRSKGKVNIYNFASQFKCVADKCIDHCCKGWQMVLDDVTRKMYESSEKQQLLDSYTKEGDAYMMKTDNKTGNCFQLQAGICSIHKNFGTELLGDACNFYPKIIRKVGSETYVSANLSCPEVTKLAILGENSFTISREVYERLPINIKNYEQEGLSREDSKKIAVEFMVFATTSSKKLEDKIRSIVGIAKNMMHLPKNTWHDAISNLLAIDPIISDPQKNIHDHLNILNFMVIMMKSANKTEDQKLVELVNIYEQAFEIEIDLENAVITLTNNNASLDYIKSKVKEEDKSRITHSLNSYFTMQILNTIFPFAGIGENAYEKIVIISIKLTLIKLGLYALSILDKLDEEHIVKLIYRTARLLDHLHSGELFMIICKEYGWDVEGRLNSLMEI